MNYIYDQIINTFKRSIVLIKTIVLVLEKTDLIFTLVDIYLILFSISFTIFFVIQYKKSKNKYIIIWSAPLILFIIMKLYNLYIRFF